MSAEAVRHHVLLVGIDAYPKGPLLHGCVNDVDVLESIFLDRLNVPPDSITKLVAPHASAIRSGRVSEDKPTADNIRRALEGLTTDHVHSDDRVFIYYSGFWRALRALHQRIPLPMIRCRFLTIHDVWPSCQRMRCREERP